MAHTHKHACPCGLIWEHPNDGAPSSEVYGVAHLCPGCGSDQRYRYFGPLAANVAHCVQYEGHEPSPELESLRKVVSPDVFEVLAEFESMLGELERRL